MFVVREYRNDCISSKYRQYRTAGIKSPGIQYRKQPVSPILSILVLSAKPSFLPPSATSTVLSFYIIGPDQKLRLSMTYPMFVGRNFAEILRALDGVMLSDGLPVATPADWQPGQDVVIKTTVSDEDAKAQFGDFKTVLPYLRMAKLPD